MSVRLGVVAAKHAFECETGRQLVGVVLSRRDAIDLLMSSTTSMYEVPMKGNRVKEQLELVGTIEGMPVWMPCIETT